MSVLNLARELKNQGHAICVGFGTGEFLSTELEKNNIPFVRFKSLIRTHNPFKNLYFVWEFKKYLDANGFDIVHINSSNALAGALAAKLSKKKPKTIFTFRGLSLLDPNYDKNIFLKNIYKAYFKFFLRFIDKKVFVSKFNYDFALKNNITDGRSTSVITNGIDYASLRFYEKEKAMSILSGHLQTDLKDKLLIGSIGRLCYAKNYEFLITIFPKILKQLPNAVLIIIGSGEEKERLAKMRKKYGLGNNIFFAGVLNNAAKYIKAFDVFTLCSRYEGLSITLIEALASGVPILASRVGGNSEVLGNFEPELYELDVMDEYIDKLSRLVPESPERNLAIESNSKQVEKYNIQKTAEEYLKTYSRK